MPTPVDPVEEWQRCLVLLEGTARALRGVRSRSTLDDDTRRTLDDVELYLYPAGPEPSARLRKLRSQLSHPLSGSGVQ